MYWLFKLFFCFFLIHFLSANEIDEYLVQNLETALSELRIEKVLEIGIDQTTKTLLDHCNQVTSIELLTSKDASRFQYFSGKYARYANWKKSLIICSNRIISANKFAENQTRPPGYRHDLNLLFDQIYNESYELVFIHPNLNLRGDLLDLCFKKNVAIIAASNTADSFDKYGWSQVQVPKNYRVFHFGNHSGLTFFVHNNRKDAQKTLKQFASDFHPLWPIKRANQLRIFFPHLHEQIEESMAEALGYLGHILLLPGKTFDGKHTGMTIEYGSEWIWDRLSTKCKNVQFIETEELLNNPPDVIFVSCFDHLDDIHKNVWPNFNSNGKTKLAYFSNYENSSYPFSEIKNLLTTHPVTITVAKQNNIPNCEKMILWIDFDLFSFQGVNEKPTFRTYINRYQQIFEHSLFLAKKHTDTYKAIYDCEFHFHENIAHEKIPQLMHNSIATIHIKEVEGFGYSIIESMCMGRPVFLYRPFSENKAYLDWAIEGKTAFFFSNEEEFSRKLCKLMYDRAFCQKVQKTCAKTIRKKIDNEQNALILQRFLDNLQ